ncbi:MAG: signal peptidase signal peptidase [Parcubacteria group bacterium]|nr:signal peptidase signal peptidase [Parcubacteria group bacterium]
MKFLGGALKETLTFLILAVIIVVPIRLFIAQPFVVEGESMHPTFENTDYLVVDELVYRFHAPMRGEVIVFRLPGDPNKFLIKRVIGLPGETVRIDHGIVSIITPSGNTLKLSEPYVVAEDATYTQDTPLGPDQYFVMGDNRPVSSDSRSWGTLPRQNIIGRVDVRLFPTNKISLLPGISHQPQQ